MKTAIEIRPAIRDGFQQAVDGKDGRGAGGEVSENLTHVMVCE